METNKEGAPGPAVLKPIPCSLLPYEDLQLQKQSRTQWEPSCPVAEPSGGRN